MRVVSIGLLKRHRNKPHYSFILNPTMKTTLFLFLLLSFQQFSTENTVALVFPDRVEIVSEAKAQTEFQQLQNKAVMTKDDQSRLVALTIALGTASRPQALPRNTSTREFLDNEVRRGVRKPLQADNYFPE